MAKKADNEVKHYTALTLEERRLIEHGINNGSTKKAIAEVIGKDNSTVGKEIKLHRTLSYKCNLPLECSGYKTCRHGRMCTADCQDYVPYKCSRRDRSPGACNGCSNYSRCRYNKYRYDAAAADKEYRETLVKKREGIDTSEPEAEEMGKIIAPLIKQGLSPYHIIQLHPELGICEKTLYNYIDRGVFRNVDVLNIDLRRKTSRKITKKQSVVYKKREDRTYLKGRLYYDFEVYHKANPTAHILEMDTVYNDVTNGPFIQTFKFIGLGFFFAIYHDKKNSFTMLDGINQLDSILGENLFNRLGEVLLTDRGSEFSAADRIEFREDGTRRTRVFYCDPMQSGQKGSLENHHEQLRYICPKSTDLYEIGLTGQDALNEALSHINSSPLESLEGKSPVQYVRFMYPELWDKMQAWGIREIPGDQITLKPVLLKPFKKAR